MTYIWPKQNILFAVLGPLLHNRGLRKNYFLVAGDLFNCSIINDHLEGG